MRERQRNGIVNTPHPMLEAAWIGGSCNSPNGLLSIVSDGKTQMWSMSRRQIFSLMAQCAETLKKMEPGA